MVELVPLALVVLPQFVQIANVRRNTILCNAVWNL